MNSTLNRYGVLTAAALAFGISLCAGPMAVGQIVINEFRYDDGADPDEAEFLELYNAGDATVDISGWDLVTIDEVGEFARDTIPGGSTIAPGDYFVIADATNVPNVDFNTGFMDIWPDANNIVELQDASDNVVDGFAYEINKNNGVEWRTAGQIAETGLAGIWGNTQTSAADQSLSRYLDGRDTNVNGRDFGLIRATPGESNNLPQVGTYTLPDISAAAPGDIVAGFTGTFREVYVVDPTVVGPNVGGGSPENIAVVPAGPSGGNAFSAWDSDGGGHVTSTDALVTGYDLNVYFNTEFFGTPGTAEVPGAESSTFGIGTSLTFYNFPDPSGLLDPGEPYPANGNTGIGWLYEKEDSASLNSLKLIDFGEGGSSSPVVAQDWTILQDIDMSTVDSGWYRLSLDFDPNTGEVTAVFDDQTFDFTTSTDLLGTFYVGYRESLDEGTFGDRMRPPLFEQFVVPGDNPDVDGDGDVDGDDLLLIQQDNTSLIAPWQQQYGSTSAASTVDAVPEPASVVILALTAGLLLARRDANRLQA